MLRLCEFGKALAVLQRGLEYPIKLLHLQFLQIHEKQKILLLEQRWDKNAVLFRGKEKRDFQSNWLTGKSRNLL